MSLPNAVSVMSLPKKTKKSYMKALEKELKKGDVDRELIPYLHQINLHPFAMTEQGCFGHVPYPVADEYAEHGRAYWGYLSMFLAANAADWLFAQICADGLFADWVIVSLSQLPIMDAGKPIMVTDDGVVQLTFAWDRSDAITALYEITRALDRYADSPKTTVPKFNSYPADEPILV